MSIFLASRARHRLAVIWVVFVLACSVMLAGSAGPVYGDAGVHAGQGPSWRVLVLIYTQTDFAYTDAQGQAHHVVAQMTVDDVLRARQAAEAFFLKDVPLLDSGAMIPTLTIRYPQRKLSHLASLGGFWPDPASTAQDLDPAFDSVVVIWDSAGIDLISGQPEDLQYYGGRSLDRGLGQTYSTFQVESLGENEHNILKHEWGHSIVFYYSHAGLSPAPMVDIHINNTDNQYVHCVSGQPYLLIYEDDTQPFTNSTYNDASGFYHDVYSGLTARPDDPDRCLGIPASAWMAGGPVTKF